MSPKIEKLIEDMSDEDKATLAGEILSEVNPTKKNLEFFFGALRSGDETVLAELCSRAAALEDSEE